MPKPPLAEPFHTIEGEMIDTFLAGHKEYRPDLGYPESYSDMTAGIRAILRMFDVKRRPLSIELPLREEQTPAMQRPLPKLPEPPQNVIIKENEDKPRPKEKS